MHRVVTAAPNRMAWTYVSGLASALDTRLLSHRAALELAAAEGLREAAARVRQTLMFAGLPDTDDPFAILDAMQDAYAAVVRRIAEASPSRALGELFLLPIEWEAFRAFLREKALGLERLMVPGAATPEGAGEQCWAGRAAEPGLEPFAEAAAAIRAAGSAEERTTQLVEGVTHVFEAQQLRQTARELGSPRVAAWVEGWLNLRLALALLRCRANQWAGILDPEAFEGLGEARQALLALAGGEERRDWRPAFAALGLAAAQGVADDDAPATIERLIDDWMTAAAHAGRAEAFGPEPVFAFLWALRVEALNLRTILAGVAVGLPSEAIAAEVRSTYA